MQKEIDALLEFLPGFKMKGRRFVEEWDIGGESRGEAIVLSDPVYCEDVRRFFALLEQPCWCDCRYMEKDPGRMMYDDEAVRNAGIDDIRAMFTWCLRGERFCPGHWGRVLADGRVTAILKRLKDILPSL